MNINKQTTELLIANGELVADTLRHLANNEIDSDYFAIVSESENGTEIEYELVITDYALQAAGTVDELVKALEAAGKRIAELELQLIKPLPIGELLQRLENQTGDPWGQKYLTEFEVRQVALPTFDGYVPHVAEELQAAFRIACAAAGISIKGE